MRIVECYDTCESSREEQTRAFERLSKALARNDIELYRSNTGVHAAESRRLVLPHNRDRSAYLIVQNWLPVRDEPERLVTCSLSLVVVAETDDIEAVATLWHHGGAAAPWRCHFDNEDAWSEPYRGPFVRNPSVCGRALEPDHVVDEWCAFYCGHGESLARSA